MGLAARHVQYYRCYVQNSLMEIPMQKPHDNTKACPTAFVQDSTLIAVIEMSLSSWLVAGMIPGASRDPLKKIDPNPDELLRLLTRWRDEAIKAGGTITRIAVAYETGRDSFWLRSEEHTSELQS